MRSGKFKRCIALISLGAFLGVSCPAFSFADAAEAVVPYCTRNTTPLTAINLAGTEDVQYDGTTYVRQNAISNLTVTSREPEFLAENTYTQPNALKKIEAESLVENNGLSFEDCKDSDGGRNLSYIENGDSAGYDLIYFPKGTKGFVARVASDTDGGSIEVRLDQPGGDLLGECVVKRTGGWQTYVDVSCSLSASIEGLHRVYLVFKSNNGNGICNLNWFKFTKGVLDPFKANKYDEAQSNYYLYKSVDFGANGPVKFKARLLGNRSGTFDLRIDSPSGTSIGTVDAGSQTNAIGCVECNIPYQITGIHDLYIVDNTNGSLLQGIDWFAFDCQDDVPPQVDSSLAPMINTNIRGYNLDMSMTVDKNSVYEVYLYTTDVLKENKQVFDISLNGTKVDTVDSQKSGLRWEKKGPYMGKVLDDGKLVINCKAMRGMATISGVQVNKVIYSKEFKDVSLKDWSYVPVMELASKGVVFGKGVDLYKPSETIIGEHAAFMMFNVMKRSIEEYDSSFRSNEFKKMSDVSPDFWAYQYMKAYYNYFAKEKMLKYDLITKKAYTAKQFAENKKVRREEFAMAIIGAKRLDYNKDGKVFALDPEREPAAMLNFYKNKDADKITDSYRYFIELALEKYLMKGDQNGFLNPKNPVTRAEAAAFIYNALNLKENNFIKPSADQTIPVPRITTKKRNVNVGILILPAPAWDSVYNKNVNDPNPDFSLIELLDRNINKPMDWVLVNPYPPAFNPDDFADALKYNSAKIPSVNNQSITDFTKYFKDLRSIAKAQTDLEADITNTGAVGYTENIIKSKLFKYWEVSLDNPSLTPDKIAKSYDILFQTSHGKITYSIDVQNKVKEYLKAGGQLWWENCLGLEIKSGEGFTDEVSFVSVHPGNNYKYPQIPVYDSENKMHPLFDNVYTIDPEKSSRKSAPGLLNKNSEISMLGDGEEWLNDDNRYISSLLPTDEVILKVQEPNNGAQQPAMAVRSIEGNNGPAGRIVITTTDIGCGITKHVTRSGGKAVEDFKFCYNLFGWMSRIAVNFDETDDNEWNGKDDFVLKATVANNGAKAQTYDLTSTFNNSLWEMAPTTEYNNYKTKDAWIQSLDANGYPNKIKLKPNQTEEISIRMRFKALDSQKYEFTLRACEAGNVKTRDVDEMTYVVNNVKLKMPSFKMISTDKSEKSLGVSLGVTDLNLNDVRPVNYELSLQVKNGKNFVDPENIIDRVELDNSNNNSPSYDNMEYDYKGEGKKAFGVATINNVKFNSLDQSVKVKVYLKKSASKSKLTIVGKLQAYDPITNKRLAYSYETLFTVK